MDGARHSLVRIACKFKSGLFMAYVFTGNKPFVKIFLELGDIGCEKLSSRFETLPNCKLHCDSSNKQLGDGTLFSSGENHTFVTAVHESLFSGAGYKI